MYILIRNGNKHGIESVDMNVMPSSGAKFVSRVQCKSYTNQSSTSTVPNDTGKQ